MKIRIITNNDVRIITEYDLDEFLNKIFKFIYLDLSKLTLYQKVFYFYSTYYTDDYMKILLHIAYEY